MWERRLLTAAIVIALCAAGAMLGVRGYGVFAYVAVTVPLAMILGFAFEAHLRTRQGTRLR
jgi:hypothetical protein